MAGPPRPVAAELVRGHLLEVLSGRWDVPVTTVAAGPGFGKSTILGQAMRLHDANPRGIEAWVSCEAGDEDAHRLAGAICWALDAAPETLDPLRDVLEALRATSPVDTCLMVDDVHELPAGSSGAGLLADLVRRLPAHAHLVLAGRALAAIPLARLRAADRVLDLREADLAFTPVEAAVLAHRAGRPASTVAALGGWPALVRLTLAAPAGVARDYLWEEVVHRLPGTDRELLLALSVLGAADRDTLAALCPDAPDPETIADRVPLVERLTAAETRVHPLWRDALARLLPAGAVREMNTRVGALLLARGDVVRAGSVACEAADADLLDQAALALVRSTLATFPHDTGARWLSAVPPRQCGRPRLLLLDAAGRQARDARDSEVDRILTEAIAAAHACGDAAAEAVGLSLATVAAHARADEPRLLQIYQLAAALPDAAREPTLRQLAAAVGAALAELRGDIDSALAALRALDNTDTPVASVEATDRFYVHLLLLAGEADDAATLADARLARSPHAHVRRMPPFARWLAGQPASMIGASWSVTPDPDANERFMFNHLVFAAVIVASMADRRWLEEIWAQLDRIGLGSDTRDAAMLAVAAAARSIVEHDEPAAAGTVEDHLAAHPLTDPVSNMHLRRFLAIGYVLSAVARRAWDAQPLGRSHQRVRRAARQLVAARQGRLGPADDLVPADLALTAFPLPWSMELAARAQAAGHPGARPFVERLVGHVGTAAHDELCWLAGRHRGAVGHGARQLAAAVPRPPGRVTRIEVIGPLRVLVDGIEARPPELRRSRVRELLAVLAVRRSVARDRLTDLLWPDLRPDEAARNLRVTLTYLRRALEPDRPPGTPSYHLRVDRSSVSLASSRDLEVDLAELHDHLAGVRTGRTGAGDIDAGLAAAVGLWRGEPLTDLRRLPAFEPEIAEVGLSLADAALKLGERRLAEGDTAQALGLAERVLSGDASAERALRLLLAARLQRGEPASILVAVRQITAVLADLGVRPEPATEMLVRQAGLRLDPGAEVVERLAGRSGARLRRADRSGGR